MNVIDCRGYKNIRFQEEMVTYCAITPYIPNHERIIAICPITREEYNSVWNSETGKCDETKVTNHYFRYIIGEPDVLIGDV